MLGGLIMGRPKGGKNNRHTKEEKLKVVKDCIDNGISTCEASLKYKITQSQINKWIRDYVANGEASLENKKKTGNRFSALYTSKCLSELDRLKLENLKLRIENERLKKGYTEKEAKEAHAGLSKKNTK